MIEVGVLGLAAYLVGVVGWSVRAVATLASQRDRSDPEMLALTLSCVGVGLVMLTSQVVDNGFFIRAVYERFAVTAATMWALQTLTVNAASSKAKVSGGPDEAEVTT
jgi:hypothetical protein